MPHIPKAFCANDNMEMVVAENSVLLETQAAWGSYYKIFADRYECPDCKYQVFLPADKVLIEHFQEGYSNVRNGISVAFTDTRRK